MNNTKFFPTALLVFTALVLIGSGAGMAALAATSTVDNVKKVIIKANGDTTIINVNSVPGAKGDKGDNGTAGANGANGQTGATGANGTKGDPGATGATGAAGRDGTNGTNGTNGKDGVNGLNGTNGKDGTNGLNGTSVVVLCTTNSTNPLCSGTGNQTHTHSK